ncbi:MAG: hypothetical protein JWN25_469, partial [Verrucomicrobiales bacterium]|nr:hypothetical protein [Verrucomicrobiales bacterium]
SAFTPIKDERWLGDGLQTVREELAGITPLSFQELSWPGYLKPDRSKLFAGCSLLLFRQLETLPEGKEHLRDFLTVSLPKHKNWQLAFLETYKANFRQLVDVEKWWALKLVEFNSRRPDKLWSKVETLSNLDEILKVPVFVRGADSELPRHQYITVSELIENSDTLTQETALNRIQEQLSIALRLSALEIAPLLEDYRATVDAYLSQRKQQTSGKGASTPTSLTPFRKATLQKLGALEKVRQKESQQYLIESAALSK